MTFFSLPSECQKTGKPGMLQSMGSQKVRHNLTTEQPHWIPWNQWLDRWSCEEGTASQFSIGSPLFVQIDTGPNSEQNNHVYPIQNLYFLICLYF